MYAKSSTGGLHRAKRKQSITCTPKVRLEDCIVPKENSITCTPKTATGGGLHSAKTKQSIRLHVRQTCNELTEWQCLVYHTKPSRKPPAFGLNLITGRWSTWVPAAGYNTEYRVVIVTAHHCLVKHRSFAVQTSAVGGGGGEGGSREWSSEEDNRSFFPVLWAIKWL